MKKETLCYCCIRLSLFIVPVVLLSACRSGSAIAKTETGRYLSEPLVTHIYTADSSAHAFNGQIYSYPSHDIESGTPENDLGSHFEMRDYHILFVNNPKGKVADNGVSL